MSNQGRYKIVESVGNHIEQVQSYDDLEKHHPSKHTEAGRDYAVVDGQREEVRHTSDGRLLVKKDFVLSVDGSSQVDIPCPVAGYVYFNPSYGVADIYDKPKPDGHIMGKVLHMDPDTFKFKNGEYVEYGQGLGIQAGTGRGGKEHAYAVHAHVELPPAQFERYIHDLSSGVIRQGQTPSPSNLREAHHPNQSINGNTLGNLIARGEGDYNSYNKGVAGDAHGKKINFSEMTIAELQRRQDLPQGHPDRLFAVGKYQIIPSTMDEAVKKLHLKGHEKLTPELQERIFSEYLIAEKRPAIKAYITGAAQGPKALHAAQEALAAEWASVADPDTGRSKYGHTGGNKASISATETADALESMRIAYAKNIVNGLSADAAYKQIMEKSQTPTQSPTLLSDPIGMIGKKIDQAIDQGKHAWHDFTHPQAAASPAKPNTQHDGLLNMGDTGKQVVQLQDALNKCGAHLKEDGFFGKQTQDAVKTFQRQHGLEPDGVVGPNTAAALNKALAQSQHKPDNTLEIGDTGASVKLAQQHLNKHGAHLAEDGFFGKQTQDAVKNFQRQHGLEPDGMIGPKTTQALAQAPERQPTQTPEAQHLQERALQLKQQELAHQAKELELKSRELALKEQTLALQEKEINLRSQTLDLKEQQLAAWTRQLYEREQKLNASLAVAGHNLATAGLNPAAPANAHMHAAQQNQTPEALLAQQVQGFSPRDKGIYQNAMELMQKDTVYGLAKLNAQEQSNLAMQAVVTGRGFVGNGKLELTQMAMNQEKVFLVFNDMYDREAPLASKDASTAQVAQQLADAQPAGNQYTNNPTRSGHSLG